MTLKKATPQVNLVKVKPANQNNVFTDRNNIINTIKFSVYIQALLGINRTYLIKCGRFVSWVTKIYSCLLMLVTLVHSITYKNESTSILVIQYASCFEYILIVFNSMAFQKQTFEYLIENMNMFDDLLNINNDLKIITPNYRGIIWMVGSLTYSVTEYFILFYLTFFWNDVYLVVVSAMTILAHDSELVLFCTVIRMILLRVRIMKAHVKKRFGEKDGRKLNKVEAMSNNIQLDTISMHRTYELLHKCAEQLNSIISLPMMILLFCSGVTTTMLLRNVFLALQMDGINQTIKLTTIIYCSVRCIRYTLMVVIPCYCSTVTSTQVSHIRTMLHDAANDGRLDKIEKRQVKAFFQLTREKEFAYAIWGVIRLNMSLPLSYSSLCTTYLVIIIQFSKFID